MRVLSATKVVVTKVTEWQDAAKSSTGLRTIAARIRNTKTELDDLGETMTTAQYEELVGMLTKHNVALTDANNEYRSTYDIMSDIAKQWSSMTSMEQAALATAMSGNRQQATFYSLIGQFQEASGAMDAMANSAGALDEAYSTYMESATFHINQFRAAFQALSTEIVQSGTVSVIVDIGTALLGVVDGIVKLQSAMGALAPALLIAEGVGVVKIIKSIS